MIPIPYGRQDINQDDIQSVIDILHSEFITQGPAVTNFENAAISYCGAEHAIALNSATSALHVACLALGLGSGDWLWTSPITFVASANCGLYCGAQVDFVDIDPQTFNLCPRALETKLVTAEREGRLPKVLVAVHMCGLPCDMVKIHALSIRYGFRIIEDASHAIGAQYDGSHIGKCTHSDITIFSFHPVKIITTAEGGMALTNSPDLAKKMRSLRSHGISRDASDMNQPSHGSWYYQQLELGYNYRMSDIQAALGCSQMRRLDNFIQQRNALAERYASELLDLPLTPQKVNPGYQSSFHLYVVRLSTDKMRVSQRDVFDRLRSQGIGVNLHYIPVHIQPFYAAMGFSPGDFPNAMAYYAQAITLPLFHGMTDTQQSQVIHALCNLLK